LKKLKKKSYRGKKTFFLLSSGTSNVHCPYIEATVYNDERSSRRGMNSIELEYLVFTSL